MKTYEDDGKDQKSSSNGQMEVVLAVSLLIVLVPRAMRNRDVVECCFALLQQRHHVNRLVVVARHSR